MKSAIESAILRAGQNGAAAFIPYLTGGYPDPDVCVDILNALDDCGATVIEIGLPFSDPLADGPVIQHSSQTALENGMTPTGLIDLIRRAGSSVHAPIVIMSYWNPIRKMGADRFAAQARDAGAHGLIIPDLPLEEAEEWLEITERRGLDPVFMITPTTPVERQKKIAQASRGFLYYVSLTGVTGADFSVTDHLVREIQAVKSLSPRPTAVGFGVSTPEQACQLGAVADGVIVGSALIRKIQQADRPAAQVEAAASLAASISQALRRKEAA